MPAAVIGLIGASAASAAVVEATGSAFFAAMAAGFTSSAGGVAFHEEPAEGEHDHSERLD